MNERNRTDVRLESGDGSLEGKHDKYSDAVLSVEQAMAKDRTAFTSLFGDEAEYKAIEAQLKEEVADLFVVLGSVGADKLEAFANSIKTGETVVPEKTAELIAQKPHEPEMAIDGEDREERTAAYHEEGIAYSEKLYTIIQARSQYKTALRKVACESAVDGSMPNKQFIPIVEAMIAQMNKVDDPLMKDYTNYQTFRFVYKPKPVVASPANFAQENPMEEVEKQLKQNEEITRNNVLFKAFMQDLSREDCVLSKRLFWDKRDYAKQILVEMIDNQGKSNSEEKQLTLWQWFLDLLFPTGKEMREKYQSLKLDMDQYREVLRALGPTQTHGLLGVDDYEKVRSWRKSQ